MHIVYQKIRHLNAYSEAGQKRYGVNENTMRLSSAYPLISDYVGRAVLAVAHNGLTGQGFVARFTDISPAPDESVRPNGINFDRALERLRRIGNAERTSVWLGGGAPSDPWGSGVADMDAERQYAEDRVRGLHLPLADLAIDWTVRPDVITHINLDPKTGTLFVEQELGTVSLPLPLA